MARFTIYRNDLPVCTVQGTLASARQVAARLAQCAPGALLQGSYTVRQAPTRAAPLPAPHAARLWAARLARRTA